MLVQLCKIKIYNKAGIPSDCRALTLAIENKLKWQLLYKKKMNNTDIEIDKFSVRLIFIYITSFPNNSHLNSLYVVA